MKFIVFGSTCSQYAATVKELFNTKMQNVLTGEQIVTHKLKPAHRVKRKEERRRRRGRRRRWRRRGKETD